MHLRTGIPKLTELDAHLQSAEYKHHVDFIIGPLSGNEGLAVRDYARTRPERAFLNGNAATQDVSIRLSSTDTNGHPRDGLLTSVVISDSTKAAMAVDISQASPGVYTGIARGLSPGVFEVTVEQRNRDSGELVARDTNGFVVPYPSEYSIVDNASDVSSANLSDLAQLGGGKVLEITQPQAALVHDIAAQPQRVLLSPWLLFAAILLFPLDVATRRLSISLRDLFRRRRTAGPTGA